MSSSIIHLKYIALLSILFNHLIMNHSLIESSPIEQEQVLLARLYEDGKEVDQMYIHQLYQLDLLTRHLNQTDQIYLIRRDYSAGTIVPIRSNDIRLNISEVSSQSNLPHKFSNRKLISYLSYVLLEESSYGGIQYFYANLQFESDQYGNFSFCVQHQKLKEYCVHQGVHTYLTLNVSNRKINLFMALFINAIALFLAALTSGLILGLMTLDTHELQVLIRAGTKDEQNAAKIIYPLRKKGNFLLCTLVLANTLSESMLNYLAGFLVQGPLVVVVSTACLVVVGQIIPLAFSTRYGLSLGSSTIYVTYFFIVICFPVAYPLGLMLDAFLGEETPTVYDKERLIEYIKLTRPINKLEKDQLDMISGVVYLRDKTVSQSMTQLKDVFMISIDMVLNQVNINNIFKRGFSRIPVYKDKREKIVSILFLKDLVLLNGPTTVKDLVQRTNHYLAFTDESEKITKIFYYMKKGKTHMIIVRKNQQDTIHVTGIITLEDIIEEILQTEISDENDYQNDLKNKNNSLVEFKHSKDSLFL